MRRRGSSTGFLPAQREGHDAERPLQQHREGHPLSKRIRRTAPKSPGPRSPHPLRKREVSNRFRIWVAPRSRYALVPKRRDGSIFLWICKANLHAPVVGGDAGHSRSRRRSVTDVGLPLAGTHRPGRMHRFYGNLRRICNFSMGRQSRRPLQQPFALSVGEDDSVRPRDVPILRESSANSQLPPTSKEVTACGFAANSRRNSLHSAGRSRAPPLPTAVAFQRFLRKTNRLWS